MKQKKLSQLGDNARFCLSNRKGSTTYRLHRKKLGVAVFTSETSSRTYSRPVGTVVWVY